MMPCSVSDSDVLWCLPTAQISCLSSQNRARSRWFRTLGFSSYFFSPAFCIFLCACCRFDALLCITDDPVRCLLSQISPQLTAIVVIGFRARAGNQQRLP